MLSEFSKKNIYLGYSYIRSLHFALQQASLPVFEYLLTGQKRTTPKEYQQNLSKVLPHLRALMLKDVENIAQGVYPHQVLNPESSLQHFKRYFKIIKDGYQVSRRRKQRTAHEFSPKAQSHLEEVPEYYQRNFHFQSDGYLSEDSADLYEHQVEILFAGAADAMRRLILKPLKKHFLAQPTGKGLHFLELAAGTGRLSRFVKLAFPEVKVTLLDISHPYLKKARQQMAGFDRVDFIQGAAEDLPFQEQKFDAVFSCFLFHELPLAVRQKVMLESLRVLKPLGFIGAVDSIQAHDVPELQWALDRFPMDFHEPFYKNYSLHPLETLFTESGLSSVQIDQGFFSKCVTAVKL